MDPQSPVQNIPTAQPPIPQQNSIVTPPPSHKKLFLITLIVILVAIVGALTVYLIPNRTLLLSKIDMKLHPSPTPKPGCFYQQVECFQAPCPPILMCPTTTTIPTVDPITNWKIYTNEKFSFSIKYPNTWITTAYRVYKPEYENEFTLATKNFVNVGFGYTKISPYNKKPYEATIFGISIKNDTNNSITNIEKIVQMEDFRRIVDCVPKQNINWQTLIINGAEVKTTTDYANMAGDCKIAITKIKDTIFGFTYMADMDTMNTTDREMFDTILSTFKFIPASPTGEDQNQTNLLPTLSPEEQYLAKSRNTYRRSATSTYIQAITQYLKDNGILPPAITTTVQVISKKGADICSSIIPKYDSKLYGEVDTNGGNSQMIKDCSMDYDTGFTVVKSTTGNQITVSAPRAELGEIISITN